LQAYRPAACFRCQGKTARQYLKLKLIQDALAGAEEARVVLARVVKRLEGG
jgi:hypothetical protein